MWPGIQAEETAGSEVMIEAMLVVAALFGVGMMIGGVLVVINVLLDILEGDDEE